MSYKALITFSFDDGHISQYEGAFPLFRTRNIPATVFINTFRVNRKGIWLFGRNRMSIQQLRELQKVGWEIGSHTVFHPYLTKVNVFRLWYELKESKKWLLSKGFVVRSISYPYGDYNERVAKVAKKYYKIARIGGSKSYVGYGPKDVLGRFHFQGIGISRFITIDQIKKYIDLAIRRKEWIHFNLHKIVENKEREGGDITISDLEKIILYIDIGARNGVLEAINFYDGYKKYREIGEK